MAKCWIRVSCHAFDQMLGLGGRLLVGCDDCGPKSGAVHHHCLEFSPKKICEYRIGARIKPPGDHKRSGIGASSRGPV